MLIAFCSNGRFAGKDTAAKFVEEWCEITHRTYERKAFADAGKLVIAKAFASTSLPGTAAEQIEFTDALKIEGEITWEIAGWSETLTGRDYIINLLNAMREIVDINVWTDAILPKDWKSTADVTAITDLRYPHEVERIDALGGVVYEVMRGSAEGGEAENEISHYGFPRLYNDGSLNALRRIVFATMDSAYKNLADDR